VKILALSDQPLEQFQNLASLRCLPRVDLIVGCGDLPPTYLEIIVSLMDVPLVYVPGNHDPDVYHVPGGEALDGRVLTQSGLLMAGLGGSRRYKRDGLHQYSERQMTLRALKLLPRLLLSRLATDGRLDLLVTHAPPLGIHDAGDPAHQGFAVFRWLIRVARPRWMLHGHMHVHSNIDVTETVFHACHILNVYPYRLIDVNPHSGAKN
jgi:Icc-related predicted phosphoesterase